MPLTVERLRVAADEGGEPILDGLSFTLASGEITLIVGRNGSGKSTLLDALSGLIEYEGTIRCDGRPLRLGRHWNPEAVRRTGYLFQSPERQLFARSVRAEFEYSLRYLKLPRGETTDRMRRSMAEMGLSAALEEAFPLHLSGGEKRRVAMASTIAPEPAWLLLDEPTAGLDPEAAELLAQALLRRKQAGTGIVVATHDPDALLPIADRIVALADGRLTADMPAAEWAARPDTWARAGLPVPACAALAARLWEMGAEPRFRTPREAAELLAQLLRRREAADAAASRRHEREAAAPPPGAVAAAPASSAQREAADAAPPAAASHREPLARGEGEPGGPPSGAAGTTPTGAEAAGLPGAAVTAATPAQQEAAAPPRSAAAAAPPAAQTAARLSPPPDRPRESSDGRAVSPRQHRRPRRRGFGDAVAELDPRSKWVAFMGLSIGILLQSSWPGAAVGAVLALIATLVCGVPWRNVMTVLRPFLLFAVLATIIAGLGYGQAEGAAGLRIGPLVFSFAQASGTLLEMFKVGCAMACAVLLAETTPPLAMKAGLDRVLALLRPLRLPVEAVSLAFALLLRFIPVLRREAERFRRIVRSRGKTFRRSGAIRLRDMPALFIPLLLSLLQLASDLALALEARGYSLSGRPPAAVAPRRLTRRDWFVVAAGAALPLLLFALKQWL
jgi:energy-coupling factor transport system ATP-binding protein